MKTIVCGIMMLTVMGMANVITYTQNIDIVKTISPAKSKTSQCKTRVDLDEGLIDNGACDIDFIRVRNKNKMWIGDLDGVGAYEDSRYADFDRDRYKGKGKSIDVYYLYDVPDASEENRWAVICPKGMIAYIIDDSYTCKKPYSCDDGMYAIDSLSCDELPVGAHRNVKDGYSCNRGFMMNKYNTCEEIVKCDTNELYKRDENACYAKPENSHWVKNSFEYECNPGYIMVGDYCEAIAHCDSTERYSVSNNNCVSLPNMAHWNDSVGISWACNDGHIWYDGACVEIPNCKDEQRYDAASNECQDPYPHSRWFDVSGQYICDTGFADMGDGICEEIPSCEYYNAEENKCFEKPPHSHWISQDTHWKSSWGVNWKCDDGYNHVLSDNTCIKCDKDEQFDVSLDRCSSKPANAYWLGNGVWACNNGYVEINGQCEEKENCWFGKRYNEANNQCVNKPAHSHWSDDYGSEWQCDAGYYPNSYSAPSECIKYEASTLDTKINTGAEVTISMGLGSFIVDSTSETYLDSYDAFALNLSVGAEFHVANDRNTLGISFLPALGYQYVDDFTTTIHLIRLELGVRLSAGNRTTHGYIMPMLLVALGDKSSVLQEETYDYYTYTSTRKQAAPDPKINDAVGGIELGVRYMGWNDCHGDFYIRIENTPANFGQVKGNDVVAYFGMRLGF